jgi:hypothetical protein
LTISETEGTTEGRPSYEDCQERPFHARGAQVRVADLAAVYLEDQFFRYLARATRHTEGDTPNLLWKARLKAS